MGDHEYDEQARSQRTAGVRPGAPSRPVGELRPALPSPGLLQLQRTVGNAATAALMEDADPLVRDVLASPGRPLDEDVRTDMEQRFGHDFSDVRIHTDGRAHESAVAIQALAYTSGSDVAFQQSRYAPSTLDGKRTLAHELTHVVQQREGEPSTPPAGTGLLVRDPTDPSELQAERTADELTHAQKSPREERSPTTEPATRDRVPPPRQMIEGLQGKSINRLRVHAPEVGEGFWGSDNSYVNLDVTASHLAGGRSFGFFAFGNHTQARITLKNRNPRRFRMTLLAKFLIDHIWYHGGNQAYEKEFVGDFDIDFPTGKQMEVRVGGRPQEQLVKGAESSELYIDDVLLKVGPTYAEFIVPIRSGSSSSYSVTGGGAVGAGAGVTGQVQGGAGSGSSLAARPITRTFHVDFDAPSPPTPIPTLWHVDIEFPVGDSTMDEEQWARLRDWYWSLDAATRGRVAAGGLAVHITGHASTTGGSLYNFDLAKRRSAEIKEYLSAFASNKVDVVVSSKGEEFARRTTGDEVESQEWRRVTVWVWDDHLPSEQPQ